MTRKPFKGPSQTALLRRGLSRRHLLAGAAATAGLVGFSPAAPFIRNAAAAATTLRLLMWQPYVIKETVAEFETKTGARFSPTFFDGNSEAFNKMKVGGTKDFDIVQADGFWPRLYFRQGLTQGVDYGKLPNIANVFPEFLPPNFPLLADETGATKVAAPNCWGGYGITVNSSRIAPEDIGSISLLLNEKYKGHFSSNSRFEENIALMGILAATNLGTIGGGAAGRQALQPLSSHRRRARGDQEAADRPEEAAADALPGLRRARPPDAGRGHLGGAGIRRDLSPPDRAARRGQDRFRRPACAEARRKAGWAGSIPG